MKLNFIINQLIADYPRALRWDGTCLF